MASVIEQIGRPLEMEKKRKAAIRGGFFSQFVDMFDIYLPTVILAPVMFYFQPEGMSQNMAAILASLIFVSTFLGRPLGAVFFGVVGDKLGRRKATIYSVTGFGVITFLIALLPGYGSIGITAYVLLVILRLLDGFFLGGGYTGAIPLAMESSEKSKRGFVGGLILSAFPAAYVVINLLGMLCFALFPLAGADSPYAMYGWRIPFIIGALLAFALVFYYVKYVSESDTWEEANEEKEIKKKIPLFEILKGKSGRNFLQVFILMTGFWLTQNIVTLFLPTTLLNGILGYSGFQLTFILLISYSVLILTYIFSGVIGQKIGRKTFFVIVAPIISIVSVILLTILVNGQDLSLGTVVLLVLVFSIITTAPWGVIPTYINERFATDVRATGFGLGYSLAVVLPSFYAFYMDWLNSFVPYQYTAVILLFVGGMIALIGAIMGPETKDVDF